MICHASHDDFDVYIGRTSDGKGTIRNQPPGESWGNPYRLEDYSRRASIRKFADLLDELLDARPALRLHLASLAGQRLGCFCRRAEETEPACHGDVLRTRAETLAEQYRGGPACAEDEHLLAYINNTKRCARCGFHTQTLTDWAGQDISGSTVASGGRT